MKRSFEVVCSYCGRLREHELAWRCKCGGPFTFREETGFEPKLVVRKDRSLRRYRKFLPIDYGNVVSLGEGCVPLVKAEPGQGNLYFKCEFMMPTGSFKDRGSTIAVSRAAEVCAARAIPGVTEDSSGNAGLSIAAYCARAGLECEVFVPETVSPAKAHLIETYGAGLRLIAGSREAVSEAASQKHPSQLYLGHVYDPYFIAGIETLAFEIAEDLDWNQPAYIYCPASAGTLLLGIVYGFERLLASDTIHRMPTVVAVQTEQVNPVYEAFHGRPHKSKAKLNSVADALVSTRPPRLAEMIQALKKHSGTVEVVDESEIIAAYSALARRGFLVEPSSAVAYAGMLKFRKRFAEASSSGVVVLTGSGLKSPRLFAVERA